MDPGVPGSLGAVDGGVLGSLGGLDGGGVLGSPDGVDTGVLGSVVCVGSTADVGVSGSCASAPVVAEPNARTTAVVKAPNLSRARLTDLSDKESPKDSVDGGPLTSEPPHAPSRPRQNT